MVSVHRIPPQEGRSGSLASAKLPAEDRAARESLWADVAALLKKAEENAAQEQQLAEAGKFALMGLVPRFKRSAAEADAGRDTGFLDFNGSAQGRRC
jgi:hypothetical protein